MTQEQRQWVRTMQEASAHREKLAPTTVPPTPPSNGARRAFFLLVNSNSFDLVMTFTILANVMLMTVEYHKIEEDYVIYTFYTTAMAIFTNVRHSRL